MAGETLRVLSGAGAGTQIPLQGDFIVGRSEAGMGNLAGDSEISRRHARFQLTPQGQVIVEDLGSTNGTLVNGQRLGGPRVLAPGDQITMGKTILQFDAPAAAQAATAAPPVTAAPAPPPYVPPAAPPPPAAAPAPPAYVPPAAPPPAAAYGAGQGFAGGPISGPPGAVSPSSRPRWLLPAAIGLAVLAIAGAIIAVAANSGSDKGASTTTQAATQAAPPAQSAPAQTPPAQTPSVRSVPALEASLKSVLSGTSSSGPRVTGVKCPPNAPSASGATFACAVTGQQGLAGAVTVTLKDSKRKAYSFKAVLHGNGFTRTVSGSAS